MIEEIRDIQTRAGAMETFIVHPDRNGPHPVVFMLMDAPGIRDELYDMARRLGTVGYYVLLPNLYYRAGKDTKYGPDVTTKGSASSSVVFIRFCSTGNYSSGWNGRNGRNAHGSWRKRLPGLVIGVSRHRAGVPHSTFFWLSGVVDLG